MGVAAIAGAHDNNTLIQVIFRKLVNVCRVAQGGYLPCGNAGRISHGHNPVKIIYVRRCIKWDTGKTYRI